MRRLALAIVGIPSLAVAVAILAAIAGAGAQDCTSSEGGPVGGVPAPLVPPFQGAATQYNLGRAGAAILAAINYAESDFDQSSLPGVHSGANSAGAAGPMQIGIDRGVTYLHFDEASLTNVVTELASALT